MGGIEEDGAQSTAEGLRFLCHVGMLCLWKQRNGRVFGRNDVCNEIDTVRNILRERQLWVFARGSGLLHFCE